MTSLGAEAHLAMIKRFCIRPLTVLAAGGGVATVIARKAALFFGFFIVIDARSMQQARLPTIQSSRICVRRECRIDTCD